MTRKEARALLGNQPQFALRAMARALAIAPWLNTEDDWKRAEALRALGYRNAPSAEIKGAIDRRRTRETVELI